MRHQVFDGLILDRFPRPGQGEDKTPPPCGILRVALLDHLDILLGAIGRIALHNDPLRPRGLDKAPYHLTKQRIFRLVLRMAFRSDETKRDWEAINIPIDNQEGESDTEKPGVMFALTPFLGQGILGYPFNTGQLEYDYRYSKTPGMPVTGGPRL